MALDKEADLLHKAELVTGLGFEELGADLDVTGPGGRNQGVYQVRLLADVPRPSGKAPYLRSGSGTRVLTRSTIGDGEGFAVLEISSSTR
jgi:hypothetical protein